MNTEQLYDMLKKVQEPKGFCFNRNKEKVFELLHGLIQNKERYGYMSCPCRLASGDREADRSLDRSSLPSRRSSSDLVSTPGPRRRPKKP